MLSLPDTQGLKTGGKTTLPINQGYIVMSQTLKAMNVLILHRDPNHEPRPDEPLSKIPVMKVLKELRDDLSFRVIKPKVDELFSAGSVRLDVPMEPDPQQVKRLEGVGIYMTIHRVQEQARSSLHDAAYIAIDNQRYDLAADIIAILAKHF